MYARTRDERRKKKGKERLRENARLYIELIIRDNGLNGGGGGRKRRNGTMTLCREYYRTWKGTWREQKKV